MIKRSRDRIRKDVDAQSVAIPRFLGSMSRHSGAPDAMTNQSFNPATVPPPAACRLPPAASYSQATLVPAGARMLHPEVFALRIDLGKTICTGRQINRLVAGQGAGGLQIRYALGIEKPPRYARFHALSRERRRPASCPRHPGPEVQRSAARHRVATDRKASPTRSKSACWTLGRESLPALDDPSRRIR